MCLKRLNFIQHSDSVTQFETLCRPVVENHKTQQSCRMLLMMTNQLASGFGVIAHRLPQQANHQHQHNRHHHQILGKW